MSFAAMPRVALANLPTPLQEASNLSAVLGGPRILIKRDDLTGLGLGGNKARKLEFILADAKQKGADVVITTGGSQSNHAAQTAAAAMKLGMECYLVLYRGVHPENQGNMLLYRLYNAKVEIVGEKSADLPKIMERIDRLAAELRSQGRTPYVIPIGGMMPQGTLGYALAVSEILDQLKQQQGSASYLIDCCGTGGTMAGIVLGAKYFKADFKVIGISVSAKAEVLKPRIADMASQTAQLLQAELSFKPEEITVYDDYIGESYGIPTKECIEAIKLVAQTEGIILDPVYTGKTMAGLINLVRQGRFTSKDTVIFMHTGGAAGLFAYHKELSA